ncbi:MAG: V-type ATP synthase subunit D [Oscillospiraceae bacterium]
MATATINPTRMELTRLKGRLKTATRGHKLLKDKRDELMKQFLDVVRRNRELRRQVEEGLEQANAAFTAASAVMSPEMLEQALLYPKQSVSLGVGSRNIMSVMVPVYHFRTRNENPTEIYPYGFAQTSAELDGALESLNKVFQDMLELAQVEKTMQLLAQDIEKTRRRVNALEYVMIPELQRNIRYISMKLDENERGNTTRLMKVKDMMLAEAHDFKQPS